MNIYLERFGLGDDSVLGRLIVDGQTRCYTLEDERRKVKIKTETCIPEGSYKLQLRRWGGFHTRYSKAFSEIHIGMLEVMDVPGFTGILVHCGNTDEDTAGCVLVGTRGIMTAKHEFEVINSKIAYRAIYPPIAKALVEGREVLLHVHTKAAA